MATFNFYNHTVLRFVSGDNSAVDTYKVVLLNASATFDATHTTLAAVTSTGANEVSGNGWPAGGVTLSNVTLATDGADGVKFDADDVEQEITGGDLGPFSAYAIYNDTDTDDPPVAFIELDAPATISENFLAKITWNTLGIIAAAPV